MRDILMPVYFAKKIGALRLLKRITTVLIFVLSKWTWFFMKVLKTNSTFTIIKRLISLSIAGASVIALTLLSSFAVDSIVSPISEPFVDKVTDGGNDVYRFYAEFYSNDYTPPPDRVNSKYSVFVYNVVATSGSTVTVRPGKISDIICTGGRLLSANLNIYDAISGNLYASKTFSIKSDGTGTVWAPYFPNLAGSWFFKTDGVNVQGAQVASFIQFSSYPPEHNIYHSELSEPVADEYNSYFICNDRLYWLSYRANGLYSFINNFELNSQLYSESVSVQSSGQGTYAGQSNGFTVEPVSISDGSFAGVGTGGTPVVGVYSGFNLGQISYVGVNTGNLRVTSNGQMTYNDLEVYPVSVNSQFLNRLFDIIVYLTDDTGFKIWLVPRSDLGQNLVLDASLYCSCFDLTNGDYISSSFSSYTGNYQYAGFDYPLEDKIESVRCYGCAFYNVNNIPVHLSDVFWGYDLEFKEWRDNMLQKLTQIYNLLNHSDSIPETTTSSFGSSVEGLSDPSYSEVSPEQVGNELNNAWGQNPDIVNNSGFVKGWISDFSIPKIIALCILALASGTVILTLGKNKADS